MVNLCSRFASMQLPEHLEDLIRNITNHFSNAPKAMRALAEFQDAIKLEILKPGQTRWLTKEPCVKSNLQQLQSLVSYYCLVTLWDYSTPSIAFFSHKMYAVCMFSLWKQRLKWTDGRAFELNFSQSNWMPLKRENLSWDRRGAFINTFYSSLLFDRLLWSKIIPSQFSYFVSLLAFNYCFS